MIIVLKDNIYYYYLVASTDFRTIMQPFEGQ